MTSVLPENQGLPAMAADLLENQELPRGQDLVDVVAPADPQKRL